MTKSVCEQHVGPPIDILPRLSDDQGMNQSESIDPKTAAFPSPNRLAEAALRELLRDQITARVSQQQIGHATVLDLGIHARGSLRAGRQMAEACLGMLGQVSLVPCDPRRYAVGDAVRVQSDAPLLACLGCQYAGWPVQTEDYFAMGSGPMRLLRGREDVLIDLELGESSSDRVVGILESDKLPTPSAIKMIASDCGVDAEKITLAVAPSTSLAGNLQIVSRSIETAMHQLHELKFDVRAVLSGAGTSPLPPPAAAGDIVGGIGRTNDAMLYGAEVTFWVDCDDASIENVIDSVPSSSSTDFGRPFAKIFADYDHDFYQVDPALFSPAAVVIHNLRSGRTFRSGEVRTELLRESFGT